MPANYETKQTTLSFEKYCCIFLEIVRARQNKTEDVKQFFAMVKVLEVKK